MNWEEIVISSRKGKQKDRLLTYVRALQANSCPVIFDLQHLSLLTTIEVSILANMVNASEVYYRKFQIPKRRTGELRDILAPYPSLKHIQQWINNSILKNINSHSCCYSYSQGRSVISNAANHIGKRVLYKVDLKDFFPSIRKERIIKIFLACGYSNSLSYSLASLCTLNNALPQGAPTSPLLSNIICKRMDTKIQELSNSSGLTYTRYADDLTFSGQSINHRFITSLKSIISSEGFITNDKKELLIIGSKKKKVVTGVSISNGKSLKLPRGQKRALKLDVHKFLKHDYMVSIEGRNFDPLFPERLIGRLNYWLQIEPDNEKIPSLIKRIREKVGENLIQF